VGARGVLIAFFLAAGAFVARADEPGKGLRDTIADKHVALAKKLEKAHPRECYEELLLALEMNPDNHDARAKLGYKRDADKKWRGAPVIPGLSNDELDPKLKTERARERKDAAGKLAKLAKDLEKNGKTDDARMIAGLALEEIADDRAVADAANEEKIARAVLGHEKKGDAWRSAREQKIDAAFEKALQAAKPAEAKNVPDDVTKLAGLGALQGKENAHARVMWTGSAESVDADALIRAAETAWNAQRYFIAGDDAGFSVDGEPKREATGAAPAPTLRPDWLVVANSEHAPFVEHAVSDKGLHAFAKGLVGWANYYRVNGQNYLIHEGHFVPTVRAEWVAAGMSEFLTAAPLQKRYEAVPDLVNEGLKRFFSGHVSGRVDICYSSAGSSTGKRAFKAGSFDQLRLLARLGLQQAPEGELRSMLAKKVNDLDQLDSAVALALFDFLLATKRQELANFYAEVKLDEPALTTFERVMKKSVEDVEQELRAWVRQEY